MTLLDELRHSAVISSIDYHFARLLGRRFQVDEAGQLLAALLSKSSQEGHSCLELDRLAELGWLPGHEQELLQAAQANRALGRPGDYLPMIRQGNRLFLHRFWHDEALIAQQLLSRAGQPINAQLDEQLIGQLLAHLFPQAQASQPDWQQLACALALLQSLTIISGGPGTGKTTIVARLLAILQRLQPHGLRVALCAPTGKAAMRLQESLTAASGELSEHSLDYPVSTIHRLLGSQPGQAGFRHHGQHPLALDLLVVDEVSMVDVTLMARLLAAMPLQGRLILLGDKDQLASVKPGAVFADICGAGEMTSFSAGLASQLHTLIGAELPVQEQDNPLSDCLVQLQQSWRYSQDSDLGQLARLVNAGQGRQAVALLASSSQLHHYQPQELEEELAQLVLLHYGAYLQERELATMYAGLLRYRVLCATRQGPLGVERLNSFMETILARHNLIQRQGPFDVHGSRVAAGRQWT